MKHPAYTDILHADFESFYDPKQGYSLTKMTTIEYCRDPRWITLGVAVAWNDEPARYLTDDEFREYIATIDWTKTAFAAFNCLFDGTALTQQYGIKPAYYICTLAVCRALLPIDRYSLKVVAPLLGLGDKLDALVAGSKVNTAGLDIYAIRDVELSRDIYKLLYPMIPQKERDVINLTIRQGAEPTLVLDEAVLQQVRDDAAAGRDAAIKASGQSESVLNSNPQFARLLKSMGLVPPTKLSDATGEETEAFANGDDEWVAFKLQYPQFSHIWDGRMAAKSNINISRAEKFLRIARTSEDHTTSMPLNYCGAHTGRSSGADGMNVQNLPSKYKSNMRKGFTAPKGQMLCVVDSAQIELRVNMWQAGQLDRLEILRNGGDIYKVEAASQFGISTDDVDKDQRQYGKLCIAEGELVLTDKGLVPIEKITTRHLVWDGVSFVHHDGVIYKGISEVMTYDGLTATPDHRVWAEGHSDPISMREAAQKMVRLTRTGDGRAPLRYVGGDRQPIQQDHEVPDNSLSMHLWDRITSRLAKLIFGQDYRMSLSVCAEGFLPPQMAAELSGTGRRSTKPLFKPEQPFVSQLRWSWNKFRVYFNTRSSKLDNREPWGASAKNGAGSGRQQWSLRTGELTMVVQDAADAESTNDILFDVSGRTSSYATMALALLVRGYAELRKVWENRGANYFFGQRRSTGQAQELDGSTTAPRRTRVYDLLNAGQNNRFTVSNRLGHNCQLGLGFGMGAKKFQKTAAAGPLGMDPIYMELEEAYDTVNKYRANNDKIPKFWRTLDQRINQMTLPNLREEQGVLTFVHEGIELPSGRMLQYPGLMQTEEGQWVYGIDKKTKFLWGGVLAENTTQALARDIVFEQMLEIDKRYRVVGSTHDEVLYLAPEQEAEEALAFGIEVFSQSPSWAPDLPVSAEGAFASYYCK